MAKVIYEKTLPVDGVPTLLLISATTPSGNQGAYVKTLVGVGNKFWWFPSVPSGKIIACDFTDAPVATADPSTNNTLIGAITATPGDVLTYE